MKYVLIIWLTMGGNAEPPDPANMELKFYFDDKAACLVAKPILIKTTTSINWDYFDAACVPDND